MTQDATAGHYRPWLEDLRKEKPHQLDDQIEQLFLEKSQTGGAAWNRLFNETIAALRFPLGGEELSLEAALDKLQEPSPATRRVAAEAIGSVFKQNIRIFTLITNTLAKDKDISDRWRGFGHRRQPPPLQPGRRPGGRCARRRGEGSLSAPVASLLQDEGQVAWHGAAQLLGSQCAAA
jgi:oligoendopeptidase F